MPRKSAEAKLINPVVKERPRIDVPLDFNEAKGAVWNAVVNSVPPDYFMPAHVEHLKSLCDCVVLKAETMAELEKEKAKKRPRLMVLAEKKRDWMRLVELEHKLLRSMRLTHQSVYHAATAANRQHGTKNEGETSDELWGPMRG